MVDRRLTWLAGIVVLWGAVIFYKLISLQVLHHQQYSRLAKARQELVVEIPGPRGTIFDRSGRPLAMSVPTESVYINPMRVPDLEIASGLLARALHMNRTELYGAMKLAYDNHRGFMWVKRKIEFDESQQLRGMHLEWTGFQKESQRHYPKGSLAAHVLGSVDFEEKGNAGVERFLDKTLRGEPGQIRLLTDVKRRGIDSQLETEARPGTSVTTTIDERIQFVAEREIADAVHLHHAISGSVVVMNPHTGEILAMASYPTFDPNLPPQPGDKPNRQNHAASVPFEPGSVFKVITLSAALETTRLTPDSLINCHGGAISLPGRIVHDSHAGMGIVPMEMVLVRSSNVGAIEVGSRVGPEKLYDYVRRFGFGQRTGVLLASEESGGKLRKLNHWGTTSWASISMGQEISVTTVQLAQAASVIANGGLLVKPRLVLREGEQTLPAEPPVRAIRPQTAITMRQMMEQVVINEHGTGRRARLAGYTAGGKTGSAQIYDFAARHYTHTYNGSFMGFAPLTNPSIVVVVTLNGTHGEGGFGGASAAPVFHAVATEALRVMEVPKDLPDQLPPNTLMAAANVDDLAIADAEPGRPNILEEGDDDDKPGDEPAFVVVGPAPPVKPVQTVHVPAPPTVPDFKGKTMRAVLAEAAAKGLTVLPDGSGIARVQSPAPGSVLHSGERIRVQFER